MVIKEEVLKWFQTSATSMRIDLICNILNLCSPYELRFFGTCIEDLGKRDFDRLREFELKANTGSSIKEILDIINDRTRGRLILYLALLHSNNFRCSKALFDLLSDYELLHTFFTTDPSREAVDELLVMFTMALYHPAFNIQQKTVLSTVYSNLSAIYTRLLEVEKSYNYYLHSYSPLHAQSLYMNAAPLNTQQHSPSSQEVEFTEVSQPCHGLTASTDQTNLAYTILTR